MYVRGLRSSLKLIFSKIQIYIDFLVFENCPNFPELPTMSRNSLRLGLRGWFLVECAGVLTLAPNEMVSGPRYICFKSAFLFFYILATGILQTTPFLLYLATLPGGPGMSWAPLHI